MIALLISFFQIFPSPKINNLNLVINIPTYKFINSLQLKTLKMMGVHYGD
jgi:hypothetical protein